MTVMCGLVRCGPGWVVAARFNGPDMGARGGNCTTRRFDTPATRRWKASCSAKPPFGPPGGPSMAGWRLCSYAEVGGVVRCAGLGASVRRSCVCHEGWDGVGGCSSFQRPGYGSTGGIALQGGSTRRRRVAGRLRVVQIPHCGVMIGDVVCRRCRAAPRGGGAARATKLRGAWLHGTWLC